MEYVFFVELSRSMYEKKGGISLLFLMFGATCRNRIGDLLITTQRIYNPSPYLTELSKILKPIGLYKVEITADNLECPEYGKINDSR